VGGEFHFAWGEVVEKKQSFHQRGKKEKVLNLGKGREGKIHGAVWRERTPGGLSNWRGRVRRGGRKKVVGKGTDMS